MSDTWFNSRMFGSGVVSRKDLFELMMRHKPTDNGDGSKERYAYIEWLGIYHAIRELPSADRPQVNAELRADFLKRQYESALEEIKRLKADRPQGEWIYGEHNVAMRDGYRCNRCDFFVPWDYEHKFIDFINDYHYCPSCGARMKGADDYERAIEQMEHDMLYEPTYNSEDGSM